MRFQIQIRVRINIQKLLTFRHIHEGDIERWAPESVRLYLAIHSHLTNSGIHPGFVKLPAEPSNRSERSGRVREKVQNDIGDISFST